MRFTSVPVVRSSSEEFASCDSINSEDSDDDCQVLDSRPPIFRAGASPAVSKSRNSSWPFRACGGGGRQPKQERREEDTPSGDSSDCLGPESDSQQTLRKQWEASRLKRRTCPAMRSEGSKAGTYNLHVPHNHEMMQEDEDEDEDEDDSGTAETVQSNGHVSPPVDHISLQELSESTTSTSSEVEAQETNGDDEVVSRPHHGMPESSAGTSLKDSPLKNVASCSTYLRKGVRRRCDEPDIASRSPFKLHRTNGTDGASTSGYVGVVDSVNMGHQCTGDSGVLEATAPDVAGQVLLGGREKLKETADFKLADEEEWARRQEELQKQAQEARRLRERKRAEIIRKNEVELRQRQRLEEIRQNHLKEERNMGFKNQIRSKVQAELERVASGCRDMATLLRTLQIPVEGGLCPSNQQVSAAYKKALLRFHPDRTSASVKGDPQQQVQAEETFKLITRMKSLLQPSMFAMDTS